MTLKQHQGADVTTPSGASAATPHNIGPAPARIGAAQKDAWLADASNAITRVSMAPGRLEPVTIRVSWTPRLRRSLGPVRRA